MELKFRKLKANEIDVRVGRVINTDKFQGCSLLLYKDARVDMNILDETVGCMNWQRSHTRDNANCQIGIYDSDKQQWVWKEDTGVESNTEAEKGLASDSFKRAGVNWGIGRELYSDSLKNIMVKCELVETKKDVWKVKNGIDWYVKEIEYADNEVSKLVIAQTTYGKDETVVYTLGNKTGNTSSNKTEDKKETKVEHKDEEQPKAEVMTLEKAKEITFEVKGVIHKVGECSNEQLFYLRDNMKDEEVLDAVKLVLMDKARTGSITDENHD